MDIWDFATFHLGKGNAVMLIVVTEVRGSSPGKKGFKMVVSSDGAMSGSIGGGVMEYKLVELAKSSFDKGVQTPFLKRQVHAPDAGEDASGLICAGEQWHAFVPLGKNDLASFKELGKMMAEGRECMMSIDPGGLLFFEATDAPEPQAQEDRFVSAEQWSYRETLRPPDTLYIFGGGHISLPLSQVCRMIGFRVVVLDDRPELNTMTSNSFASEKKLIDYREAGAHIRHPATSYVCIMTVSHASDQLILEQMSRLGLKYLGMIGSSKKVEKIFTNLRERGVSDELLARVNAPMGIAIRGETPEEIAVSIAARIIMEKNAQGR
ncbi:MAG: XdhC family protein [Bacteroidales bacterium]|nr:XdhC family protein [Bacteroidales bacterium]